MFSFWLDIRIQFSLLISVLRRWYSVIHIAIIIIDSGKFGIGKLFNLYTTPLHLHLLLKFKYYFCHLARDVGCTYEKSLIGVNRTSNFNSKAKATKNQFISNAQVNNCLKTFSTATATTLSIIIYILRLSVWPFDSLEKIEKQLLLHIIILL